MRNTLIICGLLMLTGCDHFDSDKAYVSQQASEDADQMATNIENSGTSVATIARDNVKKTGEQFRSWLITPEPPKPGNHAIAASYCYRAQTDILCYRQPMPGWEDRLVAYQGTNATPPKPPQVEPLPVRTADADDLPERKVASARPVFSQIPPPPKEEEKNTDQAPVFDATHEQLPNPLMSPQM